MMMKVMILLLSPRRISRVCGFGLPLGAVRLRPSIGCGFGLRLKMLVSDIGHA